MSRIITMKKAATTIKFSINSDASYRIWSGNKWSTTYPDFAAKYIALREAGFVEIK